MKNMKFTSLGEINKNELIDLMNNKEVGRHLPLLKDRFTEEDYHAFIKSKQNHWDDHGFGIEAFFVDNCFAGWGGLQLEEDDIDFALVLHPKFWGLGRKLFSHYKKQAAEQMNKESMTILLPEGRENYKAVLRFGFIEDGSTEINKILFKRFRLPL